MADQEAHAPEQQQAPNRGPANEKDAHAVHPWPALRISRETQFGTHSGNGDREQASETEDLQGLDLPARVARHKKSGCTDLLAAHRCKRDLWVAVSERRESSWSSGQQLIKQNIRTGGRESFMSPGTLSCGS